MKKELVKRNTELMSGKYESTYDMYTHIAKPWCFHCHFCEDIGGVYFNRNIFLSGRVGCHRKECPYIILPICKRCVTRGEVFCNGKKHGSHKIVYTYLQYGILIPFEGVLDNYATLELKPEATKKEIKLAYRKQALKWHPDKHPENTKEAEDRFKRISTAYEALMK